jgi:hypothetical protein
MVLFFPGKTDLSGDLRTLHEGCMAIDEKWILNCQVWASERVQAQHDPSIGKQFAWEYEEEAYIPPKGSKCLPNSAAPL